MAVSEDIGHELSPFQDRDDILAEIDAGEFLLMNVFGEAGIGKSRLLQEESRRLRAASPPCLVLFVALQWLLDLMIGRPEALLRALVNGAQNWLNVDWQDMDQAAAQIVTQLSTLAERMRVYLMFDTTEMLQEDMVFWRWMEAKLVGPMIVEGEVRHVFAGRVPVPWRRIEVRRALKLYHLEPLPLPDAARDLVRAVLQRNNPDLRKGKILEQAVDLVLKFSFGHPALSEVLARQIAPLWPTDPDASLRYQLCNEVIKPFVDGYLFKGIEEPWPDILWWTSALDRFDATILQRYLAYVDPALIENRPDFFFIQGIARLRTHNTVLWREADGDRLHGIIGQITRHCLAEMQPERYRLANLMAAKTLDDLSAEFPTDDPEASRYGREADTYRLRAQQESEHE